MTQIEKLEILITKKAKAGDGAFAVAWALIQLAEACDGISSSIRKLGNGDASTHLGAIEAASMKISEGLGSIATSISEIQHRQDHI